MDEDEAHQQELEQREQEETMTTPKLNAAMAKARAEIKNPHLDSVNPHFKNKFASLKAVVEATVPVYAKHGITVVQDLQKRDGEVVIYTHFLHDSGEEKTFGPFSLKPTKADAQGDGSAATYARRYHLMAVTGTVGDPDDDAEAASKPQESHFEHKQTKTKYWKGLRDAAAENDAGKARELWDELTSDQQQELWRELSSGQRSTIKELLAATKSDEAA